MKTIEKVLNKGKIFYGVLTNKQTPRKVYVKGDKEIEERDSHTGLDISVKKKIPSGNYTLNSVVNLIQ